MNNFVSAKVYALRLEVESLLSDLSLLSNDIRQPEMAATVLELKKRVHEPFMFVVVGEVKAGKSSFINALLQVEKDICAVSPAPMTDTIQQLLYGEQEEIVSIGPYLKRITQPVEILKEIAIVDTPGTNTIVEHHQEITESFIPASDLIIFVFEAKNPYRESAWKFFQFIHNEWRRKVIFILQQKDLMSAEDLKINYEGLISHANKQGIENPIVFSVSAAYEKEEKYDLSGFSAVRDFIKAHITGGKGPMLKIKNNISTADNILDKIELGLTDRRTQFNIDTKFRKEVDETLQHQSERSENQAKILTENMIAAYERTTRKYEEELSSGLSFPGMLKRSFSALFGNKENSKEWIQGLAGRMDSDLKQDLKNRLNDSAGDLADSIQQMAKLIDAKIQNSSTILKTNYEIFQEIADKRVAVYRELQEAFSAFLQSGDGFKDNQLLNTPSGSSPGIVTGSGLAIVGIIITAITQVSWLDITGGVLTGVGLLFAGVTVSLQRGKVLSKFREEIDLGKIKMDKELSNRLTIYIQRIKEKILENFIPFDKMLEQEGKDLNSLENRVSTIRERMNELENRII
jgi:GTPase SAR1 family protein